MAKKVKIKLVRGLAGKRDFQIATAKALGLRKSQQEVVKTLDPAIAGMIKKIEFMLDVQEVD